QRDRYRIWWRHQSCAQSSRRRGWHASAVIAGGIRGYHLIVLAFAAHTLNYGAALFVGNSGAVGGHLLSRWSDRMGGDARQNSPQTVKAEVLRIGLLLGLLLSLSAHPFFLGKPLYQRRIGTRPHCRQNTATAAGLTVGNAVI